MNTLHNSEVMLYPALTAAVVPRMTSNKRKLKRSDSMIHYLILASTYARVVFTLTDNYIMLQATSGGPDLQSLA